MRVKYRNFFWLAILLIGVASTALAFVSMRTKTVTASTPQRKDALEATSSRSASSLIDGNSQKERVETELITIFSKGFEPAEITRPAGKFILAVDNRSGIEEVELQLNRQEGGRVHAVRVRRTSPEWRVTVDLRPGAYVLSEAGHPNWNCRITITSH